MAAGDHSRQNEFNDVWNLKQLGASRCEWIYRKSIQKEKGDKFKSIRYITKGPTNTRFASSYSMDAPYEMVAGPWVVNLYLKTNWFIQDHSICINNGLIRQDVKSPFMFKAYSPVNGATFID
jgi:hypothetical protein